MVRYMFAIAVGVMFTLGYVLFYIFGEPARSVGTEKENLPDVAAASTLAGKGTSSKTNVIVKDVRRIELPSSGLPSAGKAVTLDTNGVVEANRDRKLKKTAYTYPNDKKTVERRLTREEILQAPVVEVIPMNINGQNMEMVVVEKDGKTYDASDGVRVFIPGDIAKEFIRYGYKVWQP